ncbi:MAG: class I SAM-dependent methyltransferase [Patescibacteria group bacterium]|nr:class I SAM-dependent methyltransferase [Patescibacteria group bacterium]
MKRITVKQCPACKSRLSKFYERTNDRAYAIHPKEYFTLQLCQTCKTVYIKDPPLPKLLGDYYLPEKYYSYQEDSSYGYKKLSKLQLWYQDFNYYLIREYIKKNSFISLIFGSHVKHFYGISRVEGTKKKILDVGCGKGDILKCYKDNGHLVEGTELFDSAKDVYKRNKIKVHFGDITKLPLHKNNYDLIRMFHVIEHTYNPYDQLKAIHTVLKPGGKLILATPNISSPLVKIFGRYWFHLDTPRHLILFNQKSLRSLLGKAGYKDIKIQCYTLLTFAHISFLFQKKYGININVLAKLRFILWPFENYFNLRNEGDLMLVECTK